LIRIKSFTKLSILCVLTIVNLATFSQKPQVEIITSGTKTSLRGLSVVNDNVVWVSGSNGKVGRTNNGGKNWNWFTVKGFEKVLIFFPGAMVDPKAYVPLCRKIADNNIKVYLIKMPWRLASQGYNLQKE